MHGDTEIVFSVLPRGGGQRVSLINSSRTKSHYNDNPLR